MDLYEFELKDLLLTAIKSEIESNRLYKKIANKTKNGLLQNKLKFLAEEEDKHREYIEDIYKNHYPKNKIKIPDQTAVPLPDIKIDEDMPVSSMLQMAMDAEKNAKEFYTGLAQRFEDGSKIHNTLMYFADMEQGHYKMMEMEKESMEKFEESDVYWPMMHVGP